MQHPDNVAARRPTEILMAEHRVIERVLACLEKMAVAARDGGELCSEDARATVDFFQTFADRCHHGKEEAQLFPMMERHGLPREVGPTAVMRQEHEIGRAHVRALAAAADDAAAGPGGARDDFVRHALDFVLLLRDHIMKEDQVLFPMADRMLNGQSQEELLTAFAAVERHDLEAGTHERFVAVADRLCERYGIGEGDVPHGTGGCCHGSC